MRYRRLLISACVIAVAAASLLVAGRGAGSSTTAATTQNGLATLVAYSRCMRSHGVPNFPDPTSSEGIPKDKIPVGSSRLLPASSACEQLMLGEWPRAPGNGPADAHPGSLTRSPSLAVCAPAEFASFPGPH